MAAAFPTVSVVAPVLESGFLHNAKLLMDGGGTTVASWAVVRNVVIDGNYRQYHIEDTMIPSWVIVIAWMIAACLWASIDFWCQYKRKLTKKVRPNPTAPADQKAPLPGR
jgi:hypothetical protein